MSKTIKIYIGLLVLLFALKIYIEYNTPKPLDWQQTYNLNDKIPYGMYVFDNEAKTLFKPHKIEKIAKTFYEYAEPLYNYDSLVKNYKFKGTLLSISGNYKIDQQSTDELFYFVSRGNSAFISTEDFPETLKDSLKFDYNEFNKTSDTLYSSLSNKHFKNQKNQFINSTNDTYFSKIDTATTEILGYQEINKNKYANFIKIPYQNGFFYLHTQPEAFTNYYLLNKKTVNYAENVLSVLPKSNLYWLTKGQNGEIDNETELQFILNQPPLKWAWRIAVFGLLVFVIFNIKRKQRIVPILKPLSNTTVDFTKTIGNLYYQEGDHQNIIDKKIIYFLERIRNEYLIDTTVLDEKFVKKLHQKTGKDIAAIETVVRLINYQRKSYHQSIEDDLIEINTAIEKIITN